MHLSSISSGLRAPVFGALKSALLLLAGLGIGSFVSAQEAPPPPPTGEAGPAPAVSQGEDAGSSSSSQNQERRRRNFNPEEMRARMMAAMREEFGVADDAEWALILERINKINELRRASFSGGMGMRMMGGPGMGGGAAEGRRMNGGSFPSNPETEALQSAIKNNAPDAEIKERLTHLREVRKENEAKLEKAQEDLRAILSVRQEAIAVTLGLLR